MNISIRSRVMLLVVVTITITDHLEYQPDFVAETADTILHAGAES